MVDRAQYTVASQLSFFRNCPEVMSRLLRKGGSLLLVAKVLVISRLLHKKLSENGKPPTIVDKIRRRLATLRRKLLIAIDRRIESSDNSTDCLVDAMCAFLLATSSSQTDVLRHFHHIRLGAISAQIEQSRRNERNILLVLQLWIRTQRDTRAIFPRRLDGALTNVQAVPLFQSPEIQNMLELDYSVHARWIGDDIKSFTPYIRHGDLQPGAVEQLVITWAQMSLSTLMSGVRDILDRIDDLVIILRLRNNVLRLWLSSLRHVSCGDKSEVLDNFRQVFKEQLVRLLRQRCDSLSKVFSTISTVFNQPDHYNVMGSPSLWDTSTITTNISSGAKEFKSVILARRHGRNDAIDVVILEYTNWLKSIEEIHVAIQSLAATRWEDNPDDIDDDDGDMLDKWLTSLNEDDPRSLNHELAEALGNAFFDLQTSVEDLVEDEGNLGGTKPILLLRVLREIKQQAPPSYNDGRLLECSIPSLQHMVARWVVTKALETCMRLTKKSSQKTIVSGRALWDGTPALPILPSQWVFRLLRRLVSDMADIGMDIWSHKAVEKVKRCLRSALVEQILEFPSGGKKINGYQGGDRHEEPVVNSKDDAVEGAKEEDGTTPSISDKRDGEIQKLFDLLYLHNAAVISGEGDQDRDGLDNHVKTLQEELHLTENMERRLRKGAAEYWKRTSLLFALLA